MKRFTFLFLFAGILVLLLVPVEKSHAIQILYEATDLADSGSGDVWQYSYRVQDHTFDSGQGITIFFQRGDYISLDPWPPPLNSDWDVLTWEADPAIPDGGAFDAMALKSDPSLADVFKVSFVWLGNGTPGSQYFEVYNQDYEIVTFGDTEPVPEPATLLLLGMGLAGLAGFKGRKRRMVQ